MARKEVLVFAPSEVLVFSPVQVAWEPWAVLVCLSRRHKLAGGGSVARGWIGKLRNNAGRGTSSIKSAPKDLIMHLQCSSTS